MVLKDCAYVKASQCRLCESNMFGVRAGFGIDASHSFPLSALAFMALVGAEISVVESRACMLGRASSLLSGCHSPVRDRICSTVVKVNILRVGFDKAFSPLSTCPVLPLDRDMLWIETCGQAVATSTSISLSLSLASHHMHTPHKQSPGPSSLSSCSIHPSGPPSRQGGSPGQGSAHVCLPSFRALSQECQSHPGAFSPLVISIWLYGDLSCSFGCRRDPLPVSSWFSMRIIPHVDVFFDAFVREDELCLLLLCHLDLPSRFGPFYSY